MTGEVDSEEQWVSVVFEIPETLYAEWESKAAFRRVSLEEVAFGKKFHRAQRQPMTVRVPFVFEDYNKLAQLSGKLGLSLSKTLAKAIALLIVYSELKDSGGKLLSKRKGLFRRRATEIII